MLRTLAVVVAVALLLAAPACGPRAQEAGMPRLYAAASLSDVLTELAGRYEAKYSYAMRTSFAGSNTLAQQLKQGAPPGVFISANPVWGYRLEKGRLLEPGTQINLLRNRLVVVVPKGAEVRPRSLDELSKGEFDPIALADPKGVPAGVYAKAALEEAEAWEAVKGKVVASVDVRAALAYVARREVPVAIVYATDAASSPDVEVAFEIAGNRVPRPVYTMMLSKGARAVDRRLYDFLKSNEAYDVYLKAGFKKP